MFVGGPNPRRGSKSASGYGPGGSKSASGFVCVSDLSVFLIFQICLCFRIEHSSSESDTLIKRVIFADSTSLQKRSPRKLKTAA